LRPGKLGCGVGNKIGKRDPDQQRWQGSAAGTKKYKKEAALESDIRWPIISLHLLRCNEFDTVQQRDCEHQRYLTIDYLPYILPYMY